MLVISVNIKLQHSSTLQLICNLNMKVSSMHVISVNIKLHIRVVCEDILDVNMKVSIYLYFVNKLILSEMSAYLMVTCMKSARKGSMRMTQGRTKAMMW